MSEQLDLGVALQSHSNVKPLTARQQQAFDYVRGHDGATADEVGAYLHSLKDRRPHPADQTCEWCERDGLSVLRSKAVAPLIRYRLHPERGRLYITRNPADRARPPRGEQVSRHVPDDPFAGL